MEAKEKDWRERTILLLGGKKAAKFAESNILVAGLGGVGAYAAELLCRAGIGKMTVIDGDTVHESNRNRQIPALLSTEGESKVEVMKRRLLDINPELKIEALNFYLSDEKMNELPFEEYDYVVDAIDSLPIKAHFLAVCLKKGIKVVSSMGAGAKIDPALVRVADIGETYNCPLARHVRKQLHKMNIYEGFKVVFSPENPPAYSGREFTKDSNGKKKTVVGTISYMPAVFGCYCASVALRELD